MLLFVDFLIFFKKLHNQLGAGGALPSTETCTRAIHQDSVICCIACPDRRGTMAAATLYTAHLSSWPGPPSPSCVYAHCSHLLNSACMRRIYFLQMFWVNFFSLLDIIVFWDWVHSNGSLAQVPYKKECSFFTSKRTWWLLSSDYEKHDKWKKEKVQQS